MGILSGLVSPLYHHCDSADCTYSTNDTKEIALDIASSFRIEPYLQSLVYTTPVLTHEHGAY